MLSALLLSLAVVLLPLPVRRGHFHRRPDWVGGVRSAAVGRAGPALAAAVVGGVGTLLSTTLVAALAGGGALLATRAELGRREHVREERRLQALVEALGAVAAELRSGRSMESAATVAAQAFPEQEAARVLSRALRAPDVPPDRSAAGPFADAVSRVAAAVRLSGRTGCSLVAVLAAVEDDLRCRLRQARDLRAAVAAPRASAVLLAGLPLLGLAMGSGIGADPWRVLTTTGTGQVLLVLGVGLEVAGLAWSTRLVRSAVP